MTIEPIGFYHCDARYPQERPRQGVDAGGTGMVKLRPRRNFEAALDDLAGIDRIWLIWGFDRVTGWKPHVTPPVSGGRKIGVFATRSPHRPNPLGLSAVKLLAVDGLRLTVAEADLLDGTPIFDVKPYVARADSFPEARVPWLDAVDFQPPELRFSAEAEADLRAVTAAGGPALAEIAAVQLTTRELSPERQRLTGPDAAGVMTLAFRTWRLDFRSEPGVITVTGIRSGYTGEELRPDAADPYGDKEVHRKFRQREER